MNIMSFRYNLPIDLAAAFGRSISAFRSVRSWIPVEPYQRFFGPEAGTMQHRNSYDVVEKIKVVALKARVDEAVCDLPAYKDEIAAGTVADSRSFRARTRHRVDL
jgi:hypothetical protein